MSIRDEILASTPRYLDELFEFLRIPSISTEGKDAQETAIHKDNIRKAAEWLADRLRDLNAQNVVVNETPGHPIVTGQIGNDPDKPTILIYGHYDVQPPGDEDLWTTPPFEPVIRDGRIYARGATDDKGQLFTHLKAVELMQRRGEMPCNIRFLVEGSEEISSKNLPEFLQAHRDMIRCNAAVISDTSIIDETTPSMTVGLRGHVRVRVSVTGPAQELHSGIFGGVVPNPLTALVKMIAPLTSGKTGRVTLPGFYKEVRKYSKKQRDIFNRRGNLDAWFLKESGAKALTGEKGYTALERIGIRPTLEPVSFHCGPPFMSDKGVVSAKAESLLTVRTVPDQDSREIGEMLRQHLLAHAPEAFEVDVRISGASSPWIQESFNGAAYLSACEAYNKVFGKMPLPEFCGGSVPIVPILQKAGASPVLIGFGLESDRLHSPDEHISINRFLKGIEVLVNFFDEFPKKLAIEKKAGPMLEI
jgi:acetylornithine deacetylase/succinyl-diaminopimelate desuccinylase-like protein